MDNPDFGYWVADIRADRPAGIPRATVTAGGDDRHDAPDFRDRRGPTAPQRDTALVRNGRRRRIHRTWNPLPARRVAVRSTPAAATVTFIDIAYPDLVTDPAAVLERIYDAAGLQSVGTADIVAGFRRSRSQNPRGAHRYLPEQFGIDAPALRERMAFYTNAFPIDPGC